MTLASNEEDAAPESVSTEPWFAVKSIGVPFLSQTRKEELKKEIN
jgi:hypothetical protein